ncbi:MAG: AMP-binding protein [Thermodesulfobacteriota bacterium]
MLGKTLADIYDRCCQYYRDRTAIVFGDQRLTFGELERWGRRLAHALKDQGFKKGDRLAVLAPNCPEILFIDYATSRLGVGIVPLAAYLQSQDLLFMIEETEARALLYHSAMKGVVEKVKKGVSKLETIICLAPNGQVPEGETGFHELMEAGSSEPFPSEATQDDLWCIIYTGGTTGAPKGVAHSHRTILATAVMELLDFGIGYHEVFLAATPLTHASRALAYPVYMRGGCCVIASGFSPAGFLDLIQKERVTCAFVVPTMIYALLDFPQLKDYDTSSLKNVIYGAAAIAPERLKEAVRTFGPVFTQLFGQVEAPMALTAFPKNEHLIEGDEKTLARLASCGRPTLAAQLRLVDENMRDVPLGEAGEIMVKSPNMMLGYWKRPAITAETITDGWLHTGDIGRQDEDGYLYIVDRKKDMIVSGGFNVFPKEIEDALHEHPAVAMAAVIGVPDEKWGEAVKALIKLKPDQPASAEEIIGFCKSRKGSLMTPKSVDFVDSIPLTPLGKPDKKAIRQKYWAGQARQVG